VSRTPLIDDDGIALKVRERGPSASADLEKVNAMYVSLLPRVVLLPFIILVAPCAMAQAGSSGPSTVGVIPMERRPMTESFEFNGRIQAINSVNIVARVTAFLEKQLFVEGSDVKKGKLLYSLEQPPFQAAVDVQKAAVAQAEAQLESGNVSLWRAQQLLRTCTTDYCISSQSIAFQTPPGWPAVPVETCCQTHWGALPNGIDWNNGAEVMICTSRAEFVTTFPNCGDPENLSQAVPLDYERPKFAIGVAWPNPKQYRYEMQSIPIVDGSDGTCVKYSSRSGQVTNWWVHELKEPKRGTYVFSAAVSCQKGEKGYYAVLNSCQLKPPSSAPAE
jgi:hypothetical protein